MKDNTRQGDTGEHDKTKQDNTRHDTKDKTIQKTRQGKRQETRQGKARQQQTDKARNDTTRQHAKTQEKTNTTWRR